MAEALATVPAKLQLAAEPPSILDGGVHLGVAVGLTSNDKESALVVPDVTGVPAGTAPVYLAKPLELEFSNIKKYLEARTPEAKKALEENDKLNKFLDATSVSIDSFYYRRGKVLTEAKAGPPVVKEEREAMTLLFQFGLNFTGKHAADQKKIKDEDAAKPEAQRDGGLIGALTGDKNLSQLFDITAISVRVLSVKGDENVKTLQAYVDGLFTD